MKSLLSIVLIMVSGTWVVNASQATLSDVSEARATQDTGNDVARSKSLLERAEVHFRENGDQAMASFSRAGEFVDGELYVYVIDTNGNFLASGGSSATLIGRNVANLTDPQGRYFIREILNESKAHPNGQVEYRWSNPTRGRSEPKIATYRRVGERILVVGYYTPHASFELAKSLVWRASHELKISGEEAFDRFNNLNGGFVQDNLYVFVVGINDGIVHAHGGQPRQVGSKASDVKDAKGKYFLLEMIDMAKQRGEGEVRYHFRNPATLKNENKRSYIVRVGNYLVGAGTYLEAASD